MRACCNSKIGYISPQHASDTILSALNRGETWSVACRKSGVALRRDGENHNLTWNCGAEGDTAKQNVLRLRQRQMRNLAAALLLSHGVPMIHMGDEYGHSKVMFHAPLCLMKIM